VRAMHDPSQRTLAAMLELNASRDPDRTFVVDDTGRLSRSETLELARTTAAGLAGLGVAKGETVLLMLDNRREFLASWFGLARLGAIEVPVNPAAVGEHLAHVVNHSRSEIAIVQTEYLPQLEAVADRIDRLERVVVVGEGRTPRFVCLPWAELARDAEPPPDTTRYSEPAAVMYTSGSTGPAKGAVLSHGQHYVNGFQPTALFELEPDDTVYVCLPLHHNMAQGYGVWVALVSGAAVRLVKRFHADDFWPDVRRHGATVLPFVGAMLVLLAKRPERADDRDNPLRVGFGVPIPPALHEPFERRFGLRLVHGYGSTEATIVAWNAGPDRVVGAAGRVLPDYEVVVVDDDDRPVSSGELGEICVRPREPFSMFSGYFHDPQRTVAALRNLWFHTGDRGRLDADGNLWFSDRTGDVIRRLGETISSSEVEQAVLAHPEVRIAAAFGVPSELIEEEVMVAVVRQEGSSLTASALRRWCAERLARYAVPRFVDFVDALPLTPTGKVEKYKLKARGVTSTTDDARTRREVRA
jgi:crotonobetaine/carnitine-CoA ligase